MEPNFFANPHAIQHWLLLQGFAESQKEEDLHEEEMEAKTPAGGVPHQQIACNNEKKEEAPAMAVVIASGSPTSDTMELASYLHRRVQEIGKQFRHRPFRINTNEKRESLPGFLQGLSCASVSLGSAIDKACEPGKLAILRENTESCLQGGERAPLLPEEKPSSEPCFTYRELSVCAEMTECTTFNLYDNGGKAFNAEMEGCTNNHLYDSRPNEGRACNTQKAHVLSLTDREENLPLSSENTCDSACLSKRIGHSAHVLPSKHREGKLPIFSEKAENACDSLCRERGFHIQDLVMWDTSPKHVSDVNFTSFQKGENLNTCLDAALGCTEGKRCSTPSHNSSAQLLCHAPSTMNVTERLSLDLKLPSLQDHAISDPEDGVVTRVQKAETDFGHAEHCSSCTCHEGVQGDPVLPESVRKQGSTLTQITHSQAVAENSSPHSNVPRSMSSVDSSECDNCGTDADKGRAVTEKPGSRSSNGADGNKSEEIDAMSESAHLDTCGKEEDDNGTLVAVGGDISQKAESQNDALDLLLDAIQVTSGEHLVAKEGADACRTPSSSHPKKHAPRRNGDKSPEERKQTSSLAKMFQATKKVNDQSCLPKRVYGRMRRKGLNSSHRILDSMRERSSPELPSNTLSVPVGSFPIVRKRSNRCAKAIVMEEPGRNAVSPVVKFKSLQAVSEVSHAHNRKGSKKLAGNKHEEGEKVLLVNGKRERIWEKQQDIDTLGKEDHFSKQEKREKFTDGDDVRKDTGKEQLLAMLSAEGDEEEQGVLSRRARVQILPNKFSDSVLQPWKKGDRRKS